jgi:hypothetical protein
MPNPVLHFEIIGKEQHLLESFYKSVSTGGSRRAWRGIRW